MTPLVLMIVLAVVAFLVGLGIGLLHNRVKPTDALMTHNTKIKEITSWLRKEKDQMLNELATRHVELSPLAAAVIVKIADEIETRFIRKDTRCE